MNSADSHPRARTPGRQSILLLSFCCAVSLIVRGEILPVKTYTAADGLLRDAANCIAQDSRGFIWFCTGQGISRFDGYSFKNLGVDEGLPDHRFQDLIETRGGEFWLATYGGLVHFNPLGQATNQVGEVKELSLVPQIASKPMFLTLTFRLKKILW